MKTAVEWLAEQLFGDNEIIGCSDELFEQAKEMEKEQIIEAWNNGYDEEDRATSNPNQYYNETFKSEQNENSSRIYQREINVR